MRWVEHGVSCEFVHPCSAVQQRHPRFAKRSQLVNDLLSKIVSTELVNALLELEAPGQVRFAYRVSCAYDRDFVGQQRDELTTSGALVEWAKISTAKPQLVDGLG